MAKIAEEQVLRAYEEHAIIEQCLAKLCEVKPNHRTFEAKLAVLEDMVRHHVEQEEELLRQAEREIGDDRLVRLLDGMLERFEEVLDAGPRLLLAESVPRPRPRPCIRTGPRAPS